MTYVPYYPQYYGYPQQFMYTGGYSNYMYAQRPQVFSRPPYMYQQASPTPSTTYYYTNPFQNYPNYGNFQEQSNTFMNNIAIRQQQLQQQPKIILQKKETKKPIAPPPQPEQSQPITQAQRTMSSEKQHNSWFKVYINKDEQRSNENSNISGNNAGINQVISSVHSSNPNRYQLAPVYDVSATRRSDSLGNRGKQQPVATAPLSSRNSLLVIKKEDENIISNQPTSEELFHLINSTTKAMARHQEELTKQHLISELEKHLITTNDDGNTTQNDSKTILGVKKPPSNVDLTNHCREILSKFVLNETSNEYIAGTGIIDYNDLGNDLNKTMQFILREINSIDAATNFLSLKLTPRQKQDIAALIVDELNKLHIPGDKWGRICSLVVNTLNQSFKEYFENKKTFPKENTNNNSWLWLLETANSFV